MIVCFYVIVMEVGVCEYIFRFFGEFMLFVNVEEIIIELAFVLCMLNKFFLVIVLKMNVYLVFGVNDLNI